MDFKWQSLILIGLMLLSLTITQLNKPQTSEAVSNIDTVNKENGSIVSSDPSDTTLNFQSASLSNLSQVEKAPERKWDVLDPEITADVALVHSLDDKFPLFYKNTRERHVLASLTKLITAVVVMEDIGLNKKIPVTQEVIDTQGLAGNLKSGEVYDARSLLKLMLLTSSNDAATAFEAYLGGKEAFVDTAREKMDEIGMSQDTKIHDGSGLNDLNKGTASDFLKLSKYILENHPKIFTWTRNYEILIQPLNSAQSRKELNINSLVDNENYLGGKTGTSQAAGQNLIALFNSSNRRILVILMGSDQRDEDALKLLNWVKEAYNFN